MRAQVARAAAAGERFDAVVVVVGLNDIKKAYRGAHVTLNLPLPLTLTLPQPCP